MTTSLHFSIMNSAVYAPYINISIHLGLCSSRRSTAPTYTQRIVMLGVVTVARIKVLMLFKFCTVATCVVFEHVSRFFVFGKQHCVIATTPIKLY